MSVAPVHARNEDMKSGGSSMAPFLGLAVFALHGVLPVRIISPPDVGVVRQTATNDRQHMRRQEGWQTAMPKPAAVCALSGCSRSRVCSSLSSHRSAQRVNGVCSKRPPPPFLCRQPNARPNRRQPWPPRPFSHTPTYSRCYGTPLLTVTGPSPRPKGPSALHSRYAAAPLSTRPPVYRCPRSPPPAPRPMGPRGRACSSSVCSRCGSWPGSRGAGPTAPR